MPAATKQKSDNWSLTKISARPLVIDIGRPLPKGQTRVVLKLQFEADFPDGSPDLADITDPCRAIGDAIRQEYVDSDAAQAAKALTTRLDVTRAEHTAAASERVAVESRIQASLMAGADTTDLDEQLDALTVKEARLQRRIESLTSMLEEARNEGPAALNAIIAKARQAAADAASQRYQTIRDKAMATLQPLLADLAKAQFEYTTLANGGGVPEDLPQKLMQSVE